MFDVEENYDFVFVDGTPFTGFDYARDTPV